MVKRVVLVVLVGCGPAAPPPAPGPAPAKRAHKVPARIDNEDRRLVILSPEGHASAKHLNAFLHDEANNDKQRRVDPATYELVDERLVHDCPQLDAACLCDIGETLKASELLYGTIREGGKGYEIELHLFDVDRQLDITWTGSAADLRATARSAYKTLTHPVH
jgi:hypothetical protein